LGNALVAINLRIVGHPEASFCGERIWQTNAGYWGICWR